MSEQPPQVWDVQTQGEPPPIVKLRGRRIYRAWTLSDGSLILRVEGGVIVTIEPMRSDVPGRPLALQVQIGDIIPGATFDDLDQDVKQTPYTKALRNKRITGMDGDTLIFDDAYGARFQPGSIRWVKIESA